MLYFRSKLLKLVCKTATTNIAAWDVLATSFLYEFLANGREFYLEKEEQPRLSDCCLPGHLVSEFF